MKNTRFLVALSTIFIYEVIMRLINPDGLSITKIIITLLVWASFFLAASAFLSNRQEIKFNISKQTFYIFIILIAWNFFSIIRSAFGGDGPLTTLLGNNETSLALLVPFALAFSIDKANLKIINSFFLGLIVFGIITYSLFFNLSFGGIDNFSYNKAFSIIFYGVFFLIPIISFQLGRNKMFILIGSILLILLGIFTGYRIIILRIFLLYLAVIAISFYKFFKFKGILIIALLSLFLPFYLLAGSFITGESAFQKYRPGIYNEEITDDTRTFLYVEVLDDLFENGEFLVGKGSSGTYYSPYFDENGGDTPYRLSVEVGILALLLKGGLIAVLLNLALLFIAIFKALFRSNNYLVICIGFMLIIHTAILFVTNYIDYSLYNVALWFFIGVCLSDEIRSLDNVEIQDILLYGRTY